MGLFDIFKKKPKFEDDFFGQLGYTKFKNSTKNFFDGEIVFQGKLMGINIYADENGPTMDQREFFEKLNNRYSKIKVDIILPYLRKELEDWIEESVFKNFDAEFEFDGISIGRIKGDKTEWSLNYNSYPMKHWVSIDF